MIIRSSYNRIDKELRILGISTSKYFPLQWLTLSSIVIANVVAGVSENYWLLLIMTPVLLYVFMEGRKERAESLMDGPEPLNTIKISKSLNKYCYHDSTHVLENL